MLPKINKILYATDLSDNSAYAFRYAINSALKHDAGIIILHVFELISTTNRFALDLYLDGDLRKKIFNESVSDTINRIRERLKIFCDWALVNCVTEGSTKQCNPLLPRRQN